MNHGRSISKRRARFSAALAICLLSAGYGLGGCGGEPTQFPPAPSLGPAPEGGKQSTAGSSQTTGNRPGSGGESEGGSDGGESTGSGGKAGTPAGGTSAGTLTGGTGGKGGSGGGDPNPNCGNDSVDEGEECDDGNRLSGDGCSSQCKNKCEACEVTAYDYNLAKTGEDLDWRPLCYDDEALAEGGPAAGVPRNELCHDMVECIRATGCARLVIPDTCPPNAVLSIDGLVATDCFCQNERPAGSSPVAIPDDCYDDTKRIDGPCLNVMLEASEGDAFGDIPARLTRGTLPIGRGLRLLRDYDTQWCRAECLGVSCEDSCGCLPKD